MTDSRARPRRPRAMRLALAAVAAMAVALAAAPASQAAFVSPLCGGSAVTGGGASFQAPAHVTWEANFRTNAFCGATAPDITYNNVGSGAGRRALGERTGTNLQGNRDATSRFAGTDQAPTHTPGGQAEQIELGPTVNPDGTGGDLTANDNGEIRTIPVASSSITIVVNMPGNCRVRDTSPQATDAAQLKFRRFWAENAQWEAAFAGDASVNTWGELLPDIEGINGRSDSACANVPITRVMRSDSSGTTFAFKQWLHSVNPARGWPEPGLANTSWPNDAQPCPPGVDPGCTSVRGAQNPGVAAAVNATANDGAIGYVDLADSRANGFLKSGDTDGNFWVPVKNGAGVLQEPTTDQVITNGVAKGANCDTVVFQNVPGGGDPTRADWSAVTGANSTTGYGICALTYILTWDDAADVYTNGTCTDATEEARARTAWDYISSIVHPKGQQKLPQTDYARLSTGGTGGNLRGLAAQGLSRVEWADGGAGPGGKGPC